MINRFIKNYLLKNSFYTNFAIKLMLKWFKQREIKKINWLDEIKNNKLENLYHANHGLSSPPRTNMKDVPFTKPLIPETNLYSFNNVLLQTRSNNFLYGLQQSLMIERVINADLNYCDYTTGYLRFHNNTHALIKKNPFRPYNEFQENVLYLGGNGSYNYYHWLIEIAPKLLFVTPQLLKKYNIQFLIVDKSIKEISPLQEILQLLLIEQNLKLQIIYKNHQNLYFFKNLFYINHRNNFVFNSKEILSSIHFSYFCPVLIKNLREACLKQISFDLYQKKYPDKIFLARKFGTVRSYNQDEVLEYFEELGFTALYLEDYSFLEQVVIFNQAKFIIGPTGAAWSNIIFCQPSTQALSWLPEQIAEFSVFSTLASLTQCDMRFVLAQAENQDDPHSNYSVQLDTIIELYEKMLT